MARVKIKNLKRLISNVDKVLQDTKQSTNLLKDIGKYSANRIKEETQKGKQLSVDNGKDAPVGKQPKLSPGYIRYRKRLRAGTANTDLEPSDLMRPGVSHLTLTGKMLESLKFSVSKRKGTVDVFPTGRRNIDVSKDLAKRGRTYLGMDRKGFNVIKEKVLRVLRRNIRNFNK